MGKLEEKYQKYWEEWRENEMANNLATYFKDSPPSVKLQYQLSLAIKKKEEGNKLFKAERYTGAIDRYKDAIIMVPEDLALKYIESDFRKFQLSVMTNTAFALLKLKEYSHVQIQCYHALKIFPNNAKLNYYLGLSLSEQGEESKALAILRNVSNFQPDNLEIKKKVEELETKLKNYKDEMKEMFGGKLSPKEESYSWSFYVGGTIIIASLGFLAFRVLKNKILR